MRYTFDDADAPSTRTTQYFEILGNRAIYHDGWIAACFHGRAAVDPHPGARRSATPSAGSSTASPTTSARASTSPREHPDKLAELQALFDAEARKYDVYPLSDQTTARALPHNRPSHLDGRTPATLLPRRTCACPELATVNLKNTSFDLRAHLAHPRRRRRGRDHLPGRRDGRLVAVRCTTADSTYLYNCLGHELTTDRGRRPLPAGDVELGVRFDYDGGGLGKGGSATLTVNGATVAGPAGSSAPCRSCSR